jgi:leader peptidase (prepilin peptidase)/N-methyltransferase
MTNMIFLLILIFGLACGSFFNVVIFRLPKKQSIIRPASYCPFCEKPIRFYDNIPLLSYMVLGGQCRNCKQHIPLRYPFIEVTTALSLVALYLTYGLSESFFLYGVLTLFLIPIGAIDFDTGLILNSLTIPGFIIGVILTLLLQFETWTSSLMGAGAGGLVVGLFALLGKALFKKESIGMGDVKLLVLIGVYVGFPEVLICFFSGAFVASFYIVVGLLFKRLRLKDTIPFGPFIAIGTLVFLLWGKTVLNWYWGLF